MLRLRISTLLIINIILLFGDQAETSFSNWNKNCSYVIEPSVRENAIYNGIVKRDRSGKLATSNVRKFETLEGCFRYNFLTKRNENNKLHKFISTEPSGLIQRMEALPKNIRALEVEIISPSVNVSRVSDLIIEIEIQFIDRFVNLQELWIKGKPSTRNLRYIIKFETLKNDTIPIEILRINLPVLRIKAPCNLFSRLQNLKMLDFDNSLWLGQSRFYMHPNDTTCDKNMKGQYIIEAILYLLAQTQLEVLSVSNVQTEGDPARFWLGALKYVPGLTYLNISANFITNEFLVMFPHIKNITILDVSRNLMDTRVDFAIPLLALKQLLVVRIGPLLTPRHSSISLGKRDVSDGAIDCSQWHEFSVDMLLEKTKLCKYVSCRIGVYADHTGYRQVMFELCMEQNIDSMIDPSCPNNFRVQFSSNVKEIHVPHMQIDPDSYTYTEPTACIGIINVHHVDISYNSDGFHWFTTQKIFNREIDIQENKIINFDLSFNLIKFKNTVFFKSFANLRKLTVSGNYFLNNSIDEICKHLLQLQTLELKNSNISSLQANLFSDCDAMQFLDLSDNNINQVTLASVPPNLKLLNLANNNISRLTPAFARSMQTLRDGFVNLSNNHFDCTCNHDALDTVKRLQKISQRVVDFESLTCLTPHGNFFISQIDTEEIRALCFPSALIYIITSLSTCAVTVCVMILIWLCYTRRYQLKTGLYRLKYRKRLKANSTDFYIMYCNKDSNWVHYVLLDKLERTYKFNTIVPERDFGAGPHVDELLTFLTRCHAYVIVLSENFIRDPCCLHDLTFAYDYRRRYGRPLVVVKMGDISSHCAHVDPKVRELLSAREYIRLPPKFGCAEAYSERIGGNEVETKPNAAQRREEQFWCKLTAKCTRPCLRGCKFRIMVIRKCSSRKGMKCTRATNMMKVVVRRMRRITL